MGFDKGSRFLFEGLGFGKDLGFDEGLGFRV